MTKKSNAALEAEIEQLRKERDDAIAAAKAAKQRDRVYGNLFPNPDRRTEKDPAWTGSFRFVIPEGHEEGDYCWIDVSVWEADPSKFKQNPPDFSCSYSATPAELAEVKESNRIEYLKQKAQVS
jgi:hypothetical protein